MNIYQKIVEVRKSIDSFKKDTKGFGFEYVSGSQVLGKIKSKMDELQLLLVPEIDYSTVHWEKHEYKNKKGEEKLDFIVTFKLIYTWINAEKPEEQLKVEWLALGQQTDDISKATGTALTYNERYYLLKTLGLPTDEDDADKKEPTGSTKGNKSDGKLTEAQIKRLYAIANSKGKTKEIVNKEVFSRLNKKVEELNKSEYDRVCGGYEKLQ